MLLTAYSPTMRPMTSASAAVLAALLALGLTGCVQAPPGWTQTPFQQTASDAGSTFAAAADLLERAHTGSLTNRYLRGAFGNFSEQVANVDTELPTLDGRPDEDAVTALVAVYALARSAIDQPCVEAECDWLGQVAAIRHAAAAFTAAAQR